MKRKLHLVVPMICVALVAARWIVAQERGHQEQPPRAAANPAPDAAASASVRTNDEQSIKAASQAFAQAFEAGDAKALAALFTAEAEYLDEGEEPIRGRDALVKAYQELFAKRKELKAEAQTDAIRFLGSDTALEEGTFTVTAKDSLPNASRFSTLHVRQGGKWLIAMIKEWQEDTTHQPSLDEVGWLIGTWESAGDELTARTTYSWTAKKAFIRADYTIASKRDGEAPSTGTQVIGIDPAVGQIRGWLFASDGGIGESTWIWEGDRWMIESVGTLADGVPTSAVNFLTRSGDDAFTWRSVKRIHGGQPEPDLPTVTVKRVAAASGAATSKGP